MKNYFSFVLLAAALLFASTAQAQALHVKADIPFDFVVGNTVYSAGAYTIEPATQSSNAAVGSRGPSVFSVLHQRGQRILLGQEKGYAGEGGGVLKLHRVRTALVGKVFLQKNKKGGTDRNLVAMLQALVGDRNAVDPGPVAAAKISNANLGTGASERAMMPRKRAVKHRHLIRRFAADRNLSLRQRKGLALEWTSDAEDSRLHTGPARILHRRDVWFSGIVRLNRTARPANRSVRKTAGFRAHRLCEQPRQVR